jgi:hypothetical protein
LVSWVRLPAYLVLFVEYGKPRQTAVRAYTVINKAVLSVTASGEDHVGVWICIDHAMGPPRRHHDVVPRARFDSHAYSRNVCVVLLRVNNGASFPNFEEFRR